MSAAASATAQFAAVHAAADVPLPPSYDEPGSLFTPLIEPTGDHLQVAPAPAAPPARLVPVAEPPGVVTAALLHQVDPLAGCLPTDAGLLATMAALDPAAFSTVVRTLGWDGDEPEDWPAIRVPAGSADQPAHAPVDPPTAPLPAVPATHPRHRADGPATAEDHRP